MCTENVNHPQPSYNHAVACLLLLMVHSGPGREMKVSVCYLLCEKQC